MRITIAAPVFNEEQGIAEFFRRCCAVVEKLPHTFSFVLVNDGSADKTLEKLKEIQKTSPIPVRIVNLSRNFGYANALTAGIEHADGDAVIIMDADLEDPPEIIPELIAEHQKGHDVVYTIKTRREDTLLRRAAFRIFHSIFARMTNPNIPEGSGSFCLMSRAFINEFKRLQESNRFIPGLRAYVGFDAGYVSYVKERRGAGIPKQTFFRLIDLSLNAFFLFSNAPARTSTVLCTFGILWAIVSMILGPSSFVGTYLVPVLGIILLIEMWILTITLFKLQSESLKRPTYIVKEIIEK